MRDIKKEERGKGGFSSSCSSCGGGQSLLSQRKRMISVDVGFFNVIAHEGSRFAFSVGGDCLNNPKYIDALKTNKIRTVVNTTTARGFSRNMGLVEAEIEETILTFIDEDWYTPLPSQLERWLDIISTNYHEGGIRVGVHGMNNGPFLIAIGLMELGLSYQEARGIVLSAHGQLHQDQEFFLETYVRKGFRNRSRTAGKN
ncbi:unnamed protein product [Nezara viridula]|uniref:Uncharacterized protein n=1 Tax=Nezara viridula TaxID=85310 RepID=A0A9P0E9S7_NEZVI|nr:unnamed protein product [Nezara viridula]